MPVIRVENAGQLSLEQRREVAHKLTEAICEVTGKSKERVYVKIEEVPRDRFAVGGKLLADSD